MVKKWNRIILVSSDRDHIWLGIVETAMALAAGCPPTYEKFGLSCYKYVREKTQWKMAQEQCMKDSGNLVSIESKEEQAYLVDYLKRHGK